MGNTIDTADGDIDELPLLGEVYSPIGS